jgi:RNA polymerase-binding transcription factor DksA
MTTSRSPSRAERRKRGRNSDSGELAREPLEVAAERRLMERGAELRTDIDRELRKYRAQREELGADNVPDSGELSVADVIAEVYLAEVDRDFGELFEVEGALRRLAAGTYGICLACGEAMEARRLEKSPQAARCWLCQTAAERRDGARLPPKL